MFDHMGIVVADLSVSRGVYQAVLSPLGVELMQDNLQADGTGWLVFGPGGSAPFFVVAAGRPSFWSHNHHAGASPIHCAFAAPTPDAVDRFHAAGLAAGARDNGAPGDRGRGYYAAYLIDPDGNNIEAGCRAPSDAQR